MFVGDVRSSIEGLSIPLDGASLASAIAARDLLDARIAVAVGAFERAELHVLDGDVTVAAWLRHRAGMSETAARSLAVRSSKLLSLPVLTDAYVDGTVSSGQVDVVLANVPKRHLERFAADERDLLPLLADLDIPRLTAAMTAWRAHADALDDAPLVEHDNEVHLSATIDGRGELTGSFDADLHAVVSKALEVADNGDRDTSLAVRRADALGTVCQHFLDNHRQERGRRNRPHVNVTVTDDTAAYTETGFPVAADVLGTLRCDADRHLVLLGADRSLLDYGRATRVWSADLYNAILVRDGGCRWPGCDRPGSWCDVHHVEPWEHGGRTSITNGVLLCRRHHRTLHRPGWHAELCPDGRFDVTRPDGTRESTPTPLARPFRPPGRRRAA